jgi:probable rRNA maturation factor
LKVELINDQGKIKIKMSLLKKVSEYISDKFDKDPDSVLNIIFIDADKIRELNKKYRYLDKETDVLSFSYVADKEDIIPAPGSFAVTIGEIYICPEVASSNVLSCKNKNWDINMELILLIIHGILHIYNYGHSEEKDRLNMERIQDSLISDVRTNFNL